MVRVIKDIYYILEKISFIYSCIMRSYKEDFEV